jgi:hypothetical protein
LVQGIRPSKPTPRALDDKKKGACRCTQAGPAPVFCEAMHGARVAMGVRVATRKVHYGTAHGNTCGHRLGVVCMRRVGARAYAVTTQ